MDNVCTQEEYERIEQLISDFCKIVLTKKDELDIDEAYKYLDSLTPEDKTCLNRDEPQKDPQIRLIVLLKIKTYLQAYDNFSASAGIERPFEFDSGRGYINFQKSCDDYYRNNNQRNALPSVIGFTLQFIQEMSEHYRIFGCFYDVRSKETAKKIIIDMEDMAKKKATEAVAGATKESAKAAVETEVDKKMNEVTKTLSETSVTILGIFAGIVLTVVAGLFYSASVLENVNSAGLYKLTAISSIVGLVCFDLLAIMFQYLERIRNGDSKQPKFTGLIITINVCLILVMSVAMYLNHKYPEQDRMETDVVKVANESKEISNKPEEIIVETKKKSN